MTNTAAPFGFRPYGHRDGMAPTAGLEVKTVSSGTTIPIFTGDVVCYSSTPALGTIISAGSTTGITTTCYGVALGFEYYNATTNRITQSSYWPGSGATGDVKCFLCSDPEQLYLVQGSTGAVLGSSCIGQVFPMSITLSSCGNTATGQSVMSLQSSLGTGLSSNGQFMLVDVYQNVAPPGVNGTSTTSEGLQIAVVQPINFIRRTFVSAVAPAATVIST